MFQIQGKVALVTGGASGIGLACARELLKNGAKGVTIADINKENGMKALEALSNEFGEGKVIFDQIDVTDKNQFEECFKKITKEYGNVDILMNSAGIGNDVQWEKEVAVNLNGTINGTLLAIQNYIHNHKSSFEGVIVNFSSIFGVDPNEVVPIYSATKHAVIGLTRAFGTQLHYGLSSVRVFAVCPGFTDTPMMHQSQPPMLNENYAKDFNKKRHLVTILQSSKVAKELIQLISTAPRGSVWLIEDNHQVVEVEYVPKTAFTKIISQ
ncbi:hypothetical protein FQA39_LY01698 [Lamprigera yunnana]|nr:hypothetical protein FQA39_LY01698 [Lamprigera yunnana]